MPVWVDGDGDGYGATGGSKSVCEVPPGWSAETGDCADGDPAIHPGAREACNGVDDDCDGTRDNAETTWFTDADGDGYGDDLTGVVTCTPPAGAVAVGGDCDDIDSAVHPGADERCNTEDDDCDGVADLGYEAVWHSDDDGDGYGSPLTSQTTCAPPAGWVLDATDCRPSDPDAYPGAEERCNDADDSCEGLVDEGFDVDGDGHLDDACASGDDCDDLDALTHPGAREYCDDGVDEDCDGVDQPCGFTGSYDLSSVADFELPSSSLTDAGRIVKVGDVTGDGVDDLLIAALSGHGGFVVPGPIPTGNNDPSHVGYELKGDGGSIYGAGRSCGLGDIDGDGVGDVGFGAPYGTDPGFYVASGPIVADVDLSAAEFHFTCNAGEYCGHGGTVADVTGDGVADVLMGAYYRSAGAMYSGEVWAAFGPLSGELSYTRADADLAGTLPSAYTGRFIVAGGDHNGDGIGDTLIAAPYADGASSGGGVVYLVSGPPTSMDLSAADAILEGSAPSGSLGEVHAMAQGDVDGDGLDDVVVGACAADRAYVLFAPISGDVPTSTADITVSGARSSALGSGLGAEDMDLDGRGDLMVGAYVGSEVVLFYSPAAGSYDSTAADASFTGPRVTYFGIGAAQGDLNGDTVPDIAVGALAAGGNGTVYGSFNFQ